MTGLDAVIFDWGGTLTQWHDIDFHAESLALAQAVVSAHHDPAEITARLHRAGAAIWGRSRDEHRSSTLDDLFAEAGLDHDPELLTAYHDFWEPHTFTDPDAADVLRALRDDLGLRVGVLSNTIWPRERHVQIFRRDGVYDLIDADVYTSEIAWTKPSPHAFRAALSALDLRDPSRCVYVGDRLYDDVWGAQQAGLRAVHVPHSRIPEAQRGHTDGRPDAVVTSLRQLPDVLLRWF